MPSSRRNSRHLGQQPGQRVEVVELKRQFGSEHLPWRKIRGRDLFSILFCGDQDVDVELLALVPQTLVVAGLVVMMIWKKQGVDHLDPSLSQRRQELRWIPNS